MPADTDIEGLKTTEYWRIYIGFPLVFALVSFFLIFFVIKHETPKYLLSLGKEEAALKSIQMSYH